MATADERNFRSSYYEKVGFRNVEEKKSLEILLKERTLDKSKLNHFCLRFPVPGMHRSYLWKLLLGVLPLQVACHDYVWSCREQSFNDLARQMRVLKLDTPSAPHNFVVMWLLETGGVPTACKDPLKRNPINENFAKLAAMMMEFFDNDVEVYWVSKGFFNFLTRLAIEMPKLTECTYSLLEKEDPELFNYMSDKELLSNLPLFDWFTSMFSVVLSESSLCKIWDKMVGGSYKILIFVAVALCVSLRKSIMTSETLNSLLNLFENVSEDASELVVNKALDLWQQHGNLINMGLEFSIKHNPTALWAAQQTFSMPNLSGGGNQNTTGSLDRPVTMPNLSILEELETTAAEESLQDTADVVDTAGQDEAGDNDCKMSEDPPTLQISPNSDSTSPTESSILNNAVFLHHINEMTKALDQLSQTDYFAPPEKGDCDFDEPWMAPVEPKKEPAVVRFDDPQVAKKENEFEALDLPGEDQVDMPRSSILPTILVALGVNGVAVCLIILVWMIFV